MFKKLIQKLPFTLLSFGLLGQLFSCIDPGKTANPEKVVLSMSDALAKKYPQTPLIEVKDLNVNKDNIVLVDVREKKEIEVSIIPGAMTKTEFEERKKANPGQFKGITIVPYCTIGLRSTLYTDKLIKEGFAAKNLKGGVLSYAHQGNMFIKNGNKTNKVHVYSEAWNLLPKSHQGIFE